MTKPIKISLMVGLALICLGLLIGVVVNWYPEHHELQRRRHQVTDVILACMEYASKHGDQFPRDLRDLSEFYGKGHPFLARAVTEIELVAPGASVTNDPDAVLIREKMAEAKGRRMVGHINGAFMMLNADGRPSDSQPTEP